MAGGRREDGNGTTMYTAIIEKEGDLYAALCPELDVASQGVTVEEATSNLREAVELFLEHADPQEIKRRRWPDGGHFRAPIPNGGRHVEDRGRAVLRARGQGRQR